MLGRGQASQDGWIELDHLFPSLNVSSEQESSITDAGGLEEKRAPEQARLCDAFLASGLSLDEAETMLLSEAVERSSGNLAGAARLLGVTRPQLTYRLKRHQDASLSKD